MTEATIQAAPDFFLNGIDGKPYSLESFQTKKLLLVVFLSPHCPYVHAYEDRLVHTQTDLETQGGQIVAINSIIDGKFPDDTMEGMKTRAEKKGYNFTFLFDEKQVAAKAYGAVVTPTAYLFDAERKLRYFGKIDNSWSAPYKVTKPYLRQAIQAVLQGRTPPVEATEPVGCKIELKTK